MSSNAVEAAARLLGTLAVRDAPLGARTTYRVGGAAALLVVADTEADLRRVRTAVMETNLDVLVVGLGSNMLVADDGFAGIAVTLGDAFAERDARRGITWRPVAACSLPTMARRAAAAGLGGLEWAVGIPGSVGGAVRMNAGGHGSDVAACLRQFHFVDLMGGPDGERFAADLAATYRHTSVRAAHVVTQATFGATPTEPAEAEAKIAEIVRWRRENQPGGQNAGSVFTNPPDDSAGRLIDSVGLQGLADRQRGGFAEARQLHPGRPLRLGR